MLVKGQCCVLGVGICWKIELYLLLLMLRFEKLVL
jgi:hypothetical protein